jgi:hypothetical protein
MLQFCNREERNSYKCMCAHLSKLSVLSHVVVANYDRLPHCLIVARRNLHAWASYHRPGKCFRIYSWANGQERKGRKQYLRCWQSCKSRSFSPFPLTSKSLYIHYILDPRHVKLSVDQWVNCWFWTSDLNKRQQFLFILLASLVSMALC